MYDLSVQEQQETLTGDAAGEVHLVHQRAAGPGTQPVFLVGGAHPQHLGHRVP